MNPTNTQDQFNRKSENSMESNELFIAVKSTLEELEMQFSASLKEACFRVQVQGNAGLWNASVHCEDNPPFVHLTCFCPIKVTPEARPQVAAVVNALNSRLRLGAFYVLEGIYVTYRLSMPLLEGTKAKTLVESTLVSGLKTMDERLHVLALCASSTPGSRTALAELAPEAEAFPAPIETPRASFELN